MQTIKCALPGCETTWSAPGPEVPTYCPKHNDLNVLARADNPDPAIPAGSPTPLKELCDGLRRQLLQAEAFARLIKDHPEVKLPDTFPNQHGEMIAQSMLAVRHIEDARMRIGKVLQYGRDGVSIFDRPEPQP